MIRTTSIKRPSSLSKRHKHQAPEQSEQETQESRDQQERELWRTGGHKVRLYNHSGLKPFFVKCGIYALGWVAGCYAADLGAQYGWWNSNLAGSKIMSACAPLFGASIAHIDDAYNYHFTDHQGNDLSGKSYDERLRSSVSSNDAYGYTLHYAKSHYTPAPILMAKNLAQRKGLTVNG